MALDSGRNNCNKFFPLCQVVQEYWGTKVLCLTSSWRSCTILNTAPGLASFSAFIDIVLSSSAFGPNHCATMFAISCGDFENLPQPFSTTYGTFPTSCKNKQRWWSWKVKSFPMNFVYELEIPKYLPPHNTKRVLQDPFMNTSNVFKVFQ